MKRKWIKIISIMLVVGFMAAAFAVAAEQTITGTVEKTDQGIVISAQDGDNYLVMGKDLTDMVGKTVKAIGTMAEGDSGKTITVMSVEEVK